MAYQNSEISLLVRMDPAKAAGKLFSAFRRAKASAEAAAAELGVTRRTFDRLVRRLADQTVTDGGTAYSLEAAVELLREKARKTRAA